MPLRGLGNPDYLGFEPRVNLAPRVGHGLGALEHARVRDNAQKGEEAWPRQTDRPAAIQLRVEPAARLRMLRKGADVGIDERVMPRPLFSMLFTLPPTCLLHCNPLTIHKTPQGFMP